MKIKDLSPNAKNPRTVTDEKLAMLKKAIAEFGDLSGIIYNRKTQQLVGGHQRQKVIDPSSVITIVKKYSKPTKTGTVSEGYIEVDGERFSYREVYWTDAKEKAANIAANKGAGEWDLPQLSEWMKELGSFDLDFDISLTMFDNEEIEALGGSIIVSEHTRTGATGVDEDDIPEKAPARTQSGDIYQLGMHRLMCGDATKESSVRRLVGDHEIDLVHTDPPYNVDYSNQDRPKAGKKDLGKIKNDSMSDEQFKEFLVNAFKNAFLVSAEDASIYIWYASKETLNFYAAAAAAGWTVNQQIIWKKPMLLGRGRYQWAHEPCIFGVKGSPFFTDDRTKTTVWDFGGYDKSKNVHPTQKPVFIPEEAIENSAGLSGKVLDLFGGSGSTLIACEKLNRQCFTMELDPHYCDVIVERWEKYTGQKAKLIARPKLKKSARAAEQAEMQA